MLEWQLTKGSRPSKHQQCGKTSTEPLKTLLSTKSRVSTTPVMPQQLRLERENGGEGEREARMGRHRLPESGPSRNVPSASLRVAVGGLEGLAEVISVCRKCLASLSPLGWAFRAPTCALGSPGSCLEPCQQQPSCSSSHLWWPRTVPPSP